MPEITIVAPNLHHAMIRIQGTSSLICNRFSERAIDALEGSDKKKPLQPREPRNPQRSFEESAYRMEDGRYGFPASGLKNCIVSAVRQVDGVTMTLARAVIHVECDDLLPISGPAPKMRRDIVRLKNGAPDVRYRAEWPTWAIDVPLVVNAGVMSVEQAVNLLNLAGFGIGIGDWRPERDGSHGRFIVAAVGTPDAKEGGSA